MPVTLTSLSDLRTLSFDSVIDVRSPAEFAEDHIPGAISLPVLSDAERARVGTIYKQDNPFAARKIGAALVARNAARHLEGPLAGMPGGWRPLVYCWRGGQRSGSFAAILREIGWRVDTIAGGYKTWRRLVLAAMHAPALPHRLVILDGFTGTAKTALLPRLAARSVQVVDLEGLAAHRGSLLGGMDRPQPSQKAWEGALAMAFAALDPARPVVVEAESSRIGNLSVPPAVWAAMRGAPRIEIVASVTARAEYLSRAYADLTSDGARLADRLAALVPLQGRERVADWLALAQAGAFRDLAAELAVHHYDPRYAKSRARHPAPVTRIEADTLDDAALDTLATRLVAEVASVDDQVRRT